MMVIANKAPSTRIRLRLKTQIFSPFSNKIRVHTMIIFSRPHENAKTAITAEGT